MPKKPPTRADFPSHLSLTITPPPCSPQQTQPQPPPNILLLLHGLGDSATAFTSFARALHLPETTILTIQAPHPLPFDLPGAHWGDDVTLDAGSGSSGGGLDMDGGFERATRLLVEDVVKGVLVQTCGYGERDILVFGFGQGGMAALCVANALALGSSSSTSSSGSLGGGRGGGEPGKELSGVVSIGAPYPLSAKVGRGKSRTPVLLVAGRDSTAVSDGAVQRTKQEFEFVEVHRYARRGDGMPRNREEMWPVMQFLARRLRSWKGVPEGSVEIT